MESRDIFYRHSYETEILIQMLGFHCWLCDPLCLKGLKGWHCFLVLDKQSLFSHYNQTLLSNCVTRR